MTSKTKKNKSTDGKPQVKDGVKLSQLVSKIKNFDELKKDYELIEENLTINGILRKLSEHMEFYLKIIQQILQPEEFHALYECAIFDDKEKAGLFDLYKRIIIAHREILKAEIQNDEKNSLSTIQFAHEEIQSVKPEMLGIVKRMQESWKNNPAEAKKAQYFG